MSDKSKIEWCDASWNPVTGCTKVSEGCRNCYALTFAERFRGTPTHYFENGFDITLRPDKLDQPLKWKRPRKIFVNSMSDLFHENVPDYFIDHVFAVMALAPHHTFQVLTKRPERMMEYLNTPEREEIIGWKAHEIFERDGVGDYRLIPSLTSREGVISNLSIQKHQKSWPLPNVWLGTSVENQQAADERIPHLIATPAAVRFLSMEPLLGAVDLDDWLHERCNCEHCQLFGDKNPLDWIIVGGESGLKARPMHPEWARSIRDQCQAAGGSFFFKQFGEWAPLEGDLPKNDKNIDYLPDNEDAMPGEYTVMHRLGKHKAGRLLDGREWNEFPEVIT